MKRIKVIGQFPVWASVLFLLFVASSCRDHVQIQNSPLVNQISMEQKEALANSEFIIEEMWREPISESWRFKAVISNKSQHPLIISSLWPDRLEILNHHVVVEFFKNGMWGNVSRMTDGVGIQYALPAGNTVEVQFDLRDGRLVEEIQPSTQLRFKYYGLTSNPIKVVDEQTFSTSTGSGK